MAAVIDLARQWVLAHPQARVRWDEADFVVPDLEQDLAVIALHAPAGLLAHGHGRYPARQAVLAAAVEGAVVDVDTALRLETRYLTSLATGRVAKNMINTFFFQNGQIKSGKSRPADAERLAEQGLRIDGRSPAALAMALASASRRVPAVLRVATPEEMHETERALDAAVRRIVSEGAMAKARAEAARKEVKVVVSRNEVDGGAALGLVESIEGPPQAAALLMGDDMLLASGLPPPWDGLSAAPGMRGAAGVEVLM